MNGVEKAPTERRSTARGLSRAAIRAGQHLIESLDDAGHGPDTAFWMWFRDVEGWRLMLSGGPLLRYGAKAAHRRVRETLGIAQDSGEITADRVGIARRGALSVARIEAAVQTGPGIHGIRIRDNVIGGCRIRRAYVYRVM